MLDCKLEFLIEKANANLQSRFLKGLFFAQYTQRLFAAPEHVIHHFTRNTETIKRRETDAHAAPLPQTEHNLFGKKISNGIIVSESPYREK